MDAFKGKNDKITQIESMMKRFSKLEYPLDESISKLDDKDELKKQGEDILTKCKGIYQIQKDDSQLSHIMLGLCGK